MTTEEIEKRITDAAAFINRAADVTQDVEAAGDLTPEEAGAIYTGLSAAGMLIEALREATQKNAMQVSTQAVKAAWEASEHTYELGMKDRRVPLPVVPRMVEAAIDAARADTGEST